MRDLIVERVVRLQAAEVGAYALICVATRETRGYALAVRSLSTSCERVHAVCMMHCKVDSHTDRISYIEKYSTSEQRQWKGSGR